MSSALIAILLIAAVAGHLLWSRHVRQRRAEFIEHYAFPPGLLDKLARKRPELHEHDRQRIAQALRQYFLIYLKSGRKFVSMPSQLADDLWHEFILYTRNYHAFCRKAFGRFFHHTPAVALKPTERASNAGLRRVWWQACKEEGIDPRKPDRLPLLFALDGEFNIADGFRYAADCAALREGGAGGVNCGGDFADSGVDGGTDGFGDSGDAGGDGGGDSGCGGGCGGD